MAIITEPKTKTWRD